MAKNFSKKLAMMLVVTVLVMLVLVPQPAECVFAISLHPCTLPVCIAKCTQILKHKFMSASCTITSTGKLCLCFG
ncbi:hypothetical protein AAZX31_04G180400 [Glycine max]|uniref:Bifunctional inhibitor/plant lipid transfer protein/seed storage helical domain-containing protein n=2 Tax=Glycine subgen. Soja TaxID=1462606 RepID=K7KL80_SOYBN|nr:hypothetical protein JHK87_010672 [Glycine soja]KAG5050008.1 hypothetical protein JHK85_011111 [Glycine max]KAG5067070.1 hypothetical protein JHK86_010801 [Glycine max]KAH1112203.1 hypothetical protein GYH30_010505 [Glycine max]KAH1255152.1 hypothetical protein GmHk_04G011412 [Glycine max]